jgi:hypothetical protein
MRGNVYRSERQRTGSVLLAVVAGIALGLVLLMASASSAFAKAGVAQPRPQPVVVIAVSHQSAVKLAPIAHAAGHKIA